MNFPLLKLESTEMVIGNTTDEKINASRPQIFESKEIRLRYLKKRISIMSCNLSIPIG